MAPTHSRNFSYPFKHYLTMLRAQPIYKPMSTLLEDYERLLAIIKNPNNCEWHTPYILNTINAFKRKHKVEEHYDFIDEMCQHLLLQTKKP